MATQQSIIFLGDSYTIGESVRPSENFPHKLTKKLNQLSSIKYEAEIIAKTGWTTGELLTELANRKITKQYKLATLLIGVNNQYRGLDIEIYKNEFEILINKAISFASHPNNVIVISIPDWGCTPFAKDRDKLKISREIDQYNSINRTIAAEHQTHYIEITSGYRLRSNASKFIADDGLHPSGSEYEFWANQLYEVIRDKKLYL
jgi:lysophospholipase L1-like esterase